MAQRHQGFVISGGDPDDFSIVFYTSCDADRQCYLADLEEGCTEDGEKIVASDWFRTPVDPEKIEGFAAILEAKMRNDK